MHSVSVVHFRELFLLHRLQKATRSMNQTMWLGGSSTTGGCGTCILSALAALWCFSFQPYQTLRTHLTAHASSRHRLRPWHLCRHEAFFHLPVIVERYHRCSCSYNSAALVYCPHFTTCTVRSHHSRCVHMSFAKSLWILASASASVGAVGSGALM